MYIHICIYIIFITFILFITFMIFIIFIWQCLVCFVTRKRAIQTRTLFRLIFRSDPGPLAEQPRSLVSTGGLRAFPQPAGVSPRVGRFAIRIRVRAILSGFDRAILGGPNEVCFGVSASSLQDPLKETQFSVCMCPATRKGGLKWTPPEGPCQAIRPC